jgi:hypothetical protein
MLNMHYTLLWFLVLCCTLSVSYHLPYLLKLVFKYQHQLIHNKYCIISIFLINLRYIGLGHVYFSIKYGSAA